MRQSDCFMTFLLLRTAENTPLDRQTGFDPVLLAVTISGHIGVPEMHQPIRGNVRVLASLAGAIDDNFRVLVGHELGCQFAYLVVGHLQRAR